MKKKHMRRHEPGLEQTNAEGVASIGKCASSGVHIKGPNVANRGESRKGLINGNCWRAWRSPGPCRCIAGACGPALPAAPSPRAFPGVRLDQGFAASALPASWTRDSPVVLGEHLSLWDVWRHLGFRGQLSLHADISIQSPSTLQLQGRLITPLRQWENRIAGRELLAEVSEPMSDRSDLSPTCFTLKPLHSPSVTTVLPCLREGPQGNQGAGE